MVTSRLYWSPAGTPKKPVGKNELKYKANSEVKTYQQQNSEQISTCDCLRVTIKVLIYGNMYSLLTLCPEDGQFIFELVEQKTVFNSCRNTEID